MKSEAQEKVLDQTTITITNLTIRQSLADEREELQQFGRIFLNFS
jgi:hypothetical protein